MRLRLHVGLLLLGTMACSSAVAAPPDFKAMMQKALSAWETMDPAKAAPFYAKEADRVFYDLLPLKYTGWNEYSEGVKKVVSAYSSIKFTLGDDARSTQRGNWAFTTATVHLDGALKDGSTQSVDARWSLVWEKRGKDWLIIHEHFSAPFPAESGPQSLYRRLGGYDAIAAVVDDFIGRLASDPQLGRFFAGHSKDSLKRIRQLVVDQLCETTGGPCYYTGRDMKSSHAGLGVTEANWNAAANHLVETLDKFKLPPKVKDEVLAAISSLKKDIVSPGGGK